MLSFYFWVDNTKSSSWSALIFSFCKPVLSLQNTLGSYVTPQTSYLQTDTWISKGSFCLTFLSVIINFQKIHVFWSLYYIYYSYNKGSPVFNLDNLNTVFTSLLDPEKWKWKSLSSVWLFATPWFIQSMEFSRPEYWSGLPFPSPGDVSNPGIKLRSPTLQADSLPVEPWRNLTLATHYHNF